MDGQYKLLIVTSHFKRTCPVLSYSFKIKVDLGNACHVDIVSDTTTLSMPLDTLSSAKVIIIKRKEYVKKTVNKTNSLCSILVIQSLLLNKHTIGTDVSVTPQFQYTRPRLACSNINAGLVCNTLYS